MHVKEEKARVRRMSDWGELQDEEGRGIVRKGLPLLQ